VLLVDASHLIPSGCDVGELHEMTKRIEKLSQAEHDLISDVHPQVSEIKEDVENVREVISPEKS
jgi:hypothetical protein